jgi:hypothetical protein
MSTYSDIVMRKSKPASASKKSRSSLMNLSDSDEATKSDTANLSGSETPEEIDFGAQDWSVAVKHAPIKGKKRAISGTTPPTKKTAKQALQRTPSGTPPSTPAVTVALGTSMKRAQRRQDKPVRNSKGQMLYSLRKSHWGIVGGVVWIAKDHADR